jgi:hypothetical protein
VNGKPKITIKDSFVFIKIQIMNDIKSFFNSVLSFTTLSERRNTQLIAEKDLDKKLLESYKECPCDTFNYVLKTRELNRVMSERIYTSSIHQSPQRYIEHMDAIDNIQTVKGTETVELCQELRDKTEIIDKILKN